MGQIVSIVHKPAGIDPRPLDHYARVSVPVAVLEANRGIVTDKKGKADRQLNVMAQETLAQLAAEGYRTAPGEMGEQIVVAGVPVDRLSAGTRVRLGAEAIIEVVEPRTGCARLRHIQGCAPADVAGRLGVMARVHTGGTIALGDPADLIAGEPR